MVVEGFKLQRGVEVGTSLGHHMSTEGTVPVHFFVGRNDCQWQHRAGGSDSVSTSMNPCCDLSRPDSSPTSTASPSLARPATALPCRTTCPLASQWARNMQDPILPSHPAETSVKTPDP